MDGQACFPFCITEEHKERKRIDRDITRLLRQHRAVYKRTLKLLLLGAGDTGKSTFIKQMKIIHGSGYSEEEKRCYTHFVYQNIFVAIQSLIRAMSRLHIPYAEAQSNEYAALVGQVEYLRITTFEEPYVGAIASLWADKGIQKCYARRREFELTDSAKYFLDDIERIRTREYVPIEQDILRVRIPTSGINEYQFDFNTFVFRMIDVGGQKTERKKWIHCFEDVVCIIFLVALSEYDQVLLEDCRVKAAAM